MQYFIFLLEPGNVKLNLSVEEFAKELINSSRHTSNGTWRRVREGEGHKEFARQSRFRDPLSFSCSLYSVAKLC